MKILKGSLPAFGLAVLTLLLAGCATPGPTARITTTFDTAQASKMLEPGNNTIKGSALIRQAGGGVVTCAGLRVQLNPATAFAKEYNRLSYGSDQGGYRDAHMGGISLDIPKSQWIEFAKKVRLTTCDAQGYFTFDNVADGDFYIAVEITWRVRSTEGGWISKLVSVSGGKTVNVVLSE